MEFKDILEKYMHGVINPEILYKHIHYLFHELIIKYEFRKISYLKFYPFISELQDEDLYKESILKEKITTILSVLEGRCNYSYDLWMKIPKQELTLFYSIWEFYKMNSKITFKQLISLKKELENIGADTIEEICLKKLGVLLLGLPTADDDFYTYNLLYCNEVNSDIINEDIEKMINILNGNRPIHLLLNYSSANCILNII